MYLGAGVHIAVNHNFQMIEYEGRFSIKIYISYNKLLNNLSQLSSHSIIIILYLYLNIIITLN